MPVLSYKKSKQVQAIAFGIMVVMIALAGWKLYTAALKVRDARAADRYYSQEEWQLAEQAYKAAAGNRSIAYREEDVVQGVAALQPVSELNSLLAGLAERAKRAGSSGDMDGLLAVYQEYTELKGQLDQPASAFSAALARLGGKQSPASLFADWSRTHQVEKRFDAAFARVKQSALAQMEKELQEQAYSDSAFSVLSLIPDEYWGGGEKNAQLQSLLKPYDEARLEAIGRSRGAAALLQEGQRLMKLYAGWGLPENWLMPKMEQLAQGALQASLNSGNLPDFLAVAKQMEATKALTSSSPTLELIRSTYSRQLEAAGQLVEKGQYQEAIDLYSQLGSYRDTLELIGETRVKWALAQPEQLLEQAAPGASFLSITTGSNEFGAVVYAVGISDASVVLAGLDKEHSLFKLEEPLEEPVQPRSIQPIPPLRDLPVLLVEADSSSRKARYIAYEAGEGQLRKLFDFEADGYEAAGEDTLIVTNDAEQGADRESYYKYADGIYAFDSIRQDFLEIDLNDIVDYPDIRVRFACTILTAEDETAIAAHQGGYVLLSGARLRPGAAVITGTWSRTDKVMQGGQTVDAILLEVEAAEQGEVEEAAEEEPPALPHRATPRIP